MEFHRATIVEIEVQAVEELSDILDCLLSKSTACLSQSEIQLVETALSQRASIYEHLEAYDMGLQDFCQLLTLQPSHLLVSWDVGKLMLCCLHCYTPVLQRHLSFAEV